MWLFIVLRGLIVIYWCFWVVDWFDCVVVLLFEFSCAGWFVSVCNCCGLYIVYGFSCWFGLVGGLYVCVVGLFGVLLCLEFELVVGSGLICFRFWL